jgi:hypothetical protein
MGDIIKFKPLCNGKTSPNQSDVYTPDPSDVHAGRVAEAILINIGDFLAVIGDDCVTEENLPAVVDGVARILRREFDLIREGR